MRVLTQLAARHVDYTAIFIIRRTQLQCVTRDSYSSKETIHNYKAMRARIIGHRVHSTESKPGIDSI